MRYTAKNAQVATSLLTSCNTDLLPTSRYQDAFTWLETACRRQDYSKLSTNLLSTGLLQVVSTSCAKSTNDKLQQALLQPGEIIEN